MGSRGASSGVGGAPAGFSVTTSDGMNLSFRRGPNNMVLDLEGVPKEHITLSYNETYKRISQKANEEGLTITKYTSKELASMDKALSEERRNKPDYELSIGTSWGTRGRGKVIRYRHGRAVPT